MPNPCPPLLLALLVWAVAASSATAAGPVAPYEQAPVARAMPPQSGQLDALVRDGLKATGGTLARPCSDAVFLRRAYLDVLGSLPAADTARAFLADTTPDKRRALIERLLASDGFADYWGMKWGDILRVKSEFPVNLWPNAAQAYDHWLRANIRDNTPLSRMAWDLLTASGSNFRVPAVNFYRSAGGNDPKSIARAVAQTFMGQRAESWPPAKLDDMAVFFSRIGLKKTSEWKEEIVYFDGIDTARPLPASARLPNGSSVALPPGQDPREVFARWLIESKDSPFARNAANRIWFWLMGRGIIHEPDDIRPDNPPVNPQLLAFLAKELVASNHDFKHLCRLILNSDTYQASSIPAAPSAAATPFASYPLRRLEAEVLIDAINGITGSKDEYSSMIPEPFTFVPAGSRALALPDGSITSTFLELFGRPPRDTGRLTERGERTTAAQRLHLLNSSHILAKINKSENLRAIYKSSTDPAEVADLLYLTILSRHPLESELTAIRAYRNADGTKPWQVPLDVTWALLNCPEFLFRH